MVKEKTRDTRKGKKTESDRVSSGKNWFATHRTIIWEISLVLFGIILGVGGSALSAGYQNHQSDDSVARGLYNELNASSNSVNIWAPILIEGVPPQPAIDNSLIPNTSVFPSVNDKIQRFDKNLKQNITFYYSNLSEAEDYRLKLEEIQKIDTSQNSTDSSYHQNNLFLEKEYFNAMKSKLLYCYKQLPIIKNQIEKIFKI